MRNLNDFSEIIEKVKKSDSQLLFLGLQDLKKYFKSWYQEEPSALIPRGFEDEEEDLPILTVSFIQRDRLESSEVFGDSLQRHWVWHGTHPWSTDWRGSKERQTFAVTDFPFSMILLRVSSSIKDQNNLKQKGLWGNGYRELKFGLWTQKASSCVVKNNKINSDEAFGDTKSKVCISAKSCNRNSHVSSQLCCVCCCCQIHQCNVH